MKGFVKDLPSTYTYKNIIKTLSKDILNLNLRMVFFFDILPPTYFVKQNFLFKKTNLTQQQLAH